MTRHANRWYPVTLTGKVVVVAYAFVPPYIALAQTTGTFEPDLQTPLLAGMLIVLLCMVVSKYTEQQPFKAKRHHR